MASVASKCVEREAVNFSLFSVAQERLLSSPLWQLLICVYNGKPPDMRASQSSAAFVEEQRKANKWNIQLPVEVHGSLCTAPPRALSSGRRWRLYTGYLCQNSLMSARSARKHCFDKRRGRTRSCSFSKNFLYYQMHEQLNTTSFTDTAATREVCSY